MSEHDEKPTELPPTHAGGVVWRTGAEGRPEFLLVRPARGGPEWVLPKGHIEPGESPAAAAVREVREEAGVEAAIEGQLRSHRFNWGGREVRLACYLLRAESEGQPEELREQTWVPLEDAIACATHENVKRSLAEAGRRVPPR